MPLLNFKLFSMHPHHLATRERCRISIVFAVISSVFTTTLLLCYGIGMHIRYTNNTDNVNLQNNNNSSNNQTQVMSNIPIMLLTNEFSTMPLASNSNQKNNNNNTNTTSISNHQHYKINVAADENLHVNRIAIRGNNNTNLPVTLPLDMNQQNRFVDEINIGNQRGVFNEHLTAINSTTTTTKAANPTTANSMNIADTGKATKYDGIKTEYMRQGQQQSQQHEMQSNNELVLHRQKRYLIFPEGSSFQLVFDLIIGVVGYTSYAILGITCAVAWELPSKPPSELIENLHDKITEGLYTTTSETKPPPPPPAAPAMRRNDSIRPYNVNGGVGGSSGDIKYGIEGITYVDNVNMMAPARINYENMPPSQVVTSQPPTVLNSQNSMGAAYFSHERQSNPFGAPISGYYNAYKKVSPVDTRYYTTDEAYQPTNFYANAHYNNKNNYKMPYRHAFLDKNAKSSYYNVNSSQNESSNNNNNKNSRKSFRYSAHGDSTDKQRTKFSNRWQQQQKQQQRNRQPQHKKWQSWQVYDNDWRSYQQHQEKLKHTKWAQQQQQEQKWATQSKYVGTNNWWARNKQHFNEIWRTKQSVLRRDNVRIPEASTQPRQPVMTYSPPAESLASAYSTVNPKTETTNGRNFHDAPRLLLKKPPKAKIYPIFGRRRRRSQRSTDAKLDAFEFKLERIHLREQLRTRQKLYGKIEKLYETRGLNGTACVLRALCETGQQQQQRYKTEPQSFITELLRAIFTLPTISINSAGEYVKFEEAALQPTDLHIIDRTYREAQAQHDSCAQLFNMCEHSFWE
ncbi:serine/threonine-protein kinase pakD [Eurosta solidaginis]|uniref:serine/threonine-protein kinase pakD n=1 Tax=Eurosta solidaginis TaxID=178769 RepID=UPI0035307812